MCVCVCVCVMSDTCRSERCLGAEGSGGRPTETATADEHQSVPAAQGIIVIPSYTHTHIHAYMHTRIHAYTHTRIHAYTHTHIHAYTHTRIHAYMYLELCYTFILIQ